MAGMFVPQMVTPVDTSFLRDIGNTIGTLKQDSEIADILKGIDPYDPNSKQRVINDLRQHSAAGRDMADRMEGLDIRRQTANQQGEYQKGMLGVSQGNLTLAQQKATREQEQAADFTKGMADYRRQFGGGGGLGAVPSAAAAPAAPVARPAAPAPAAEEDDDWNGPGEGGKAPATRAAPIIQAPAAAAARPVIGGFATQPAPGVQAAGGLLAIGAAPQAPPQAPAATLPAPPPAPVGGTAGTGAAEIPAPQRIFPALAAGAAYAANRGAPAAPATPVAAAAPAAPAEPAADTGDVPGAEELPAPGTPQSRAAPDLTPRQIELRNANRFLGQMMSHPAATPGRIRGIQAQIAENDAEFAGIEAARTRGEKERDAAQKVVTAQAAKDRSKLLLDMGKQTQDNIDLKDNLKALKRVANSPSYAGGVGGATRAGVGALGIEVNKMLKEYTGVGLDERLGPDFYNRWIQDPVSRRRTAETLIKALTLRSAGGTFGTNISNADREAIARINATLSDDPETINRIVDMHLAVIDRQDKMFQLALQGEKKGKTAAQIQARLSRYGRENPLFEGTSASEKIGGPKEGEPTKLGRTIDPSGARDYDAAQKAAREQDAKVREQFRDPGAGEAAVIGDRPPKPTEGLYPFPRNVYPQGPKFADPLSNAVGDAAGAAAEAVRPTLERAQAGAKEFLRGSNPVSDFFRTNRMTYGPGGPGAAVPAPQQAERTDPFYENSDIRGIVEQGPRLAPGGIPWESMRRSTNVERQPEPRTTSQFGRQLPPEPLRTSQDLEQWRQYDPGLVRWMEDTATEARRTLPPQGPLSEQAGLADLSSMQANRRYDALARDFMAQTGRQLPPIAPLPLPPLPRPKPRRREERR